MCTQRCTHTDVQSTFVCRHIPNYCLIPYVIYISYNDCYLDSLSRLSQISSCRKDGFLFTSVVLKQFMVSCSFSNASVCYWVHIPMLPPSTTCKHQCLSLFPYPVLYLLTPLFGFDSSRLVGSSFGSVFLACSLVALSPVRSDCLQKSQDRDVQQRVLVQTMGMF